MKIAFWLLGLAIICAYCLYRMYRPREKSKTTESHEAHEQQPNDHPPQNELIQNDMLNDNQDLDNKNANAMNTITGKVILKETGMGIPDLLVVIYDLDPNTQSDESFDKEENAPSIVGDRIGSVLTAQDGSWTLSYNDTEFQVLNPTEKRPDLQLMVMAPEDGDSQDSPEVLFSSNLLRVNSGRTEAYLVRLTIQQLEDAEIPIPTEEKTDNTTENKIASYRDKKSAQYQLKTGIKQVNEDFEILEKDKNNELRNTFKDAILPNKTVLNSLYNFVKETDKISDVQTVVFTKGADNIDKKINTLGYTDVGGGVPSTPLPGKGIKMNLILTEQDKTDLQPFLSWHNGKAYYTLPESEVEKILSRREKDDGINTILFSNNPISKYCIQKSADEKCAMYHTDLSDDHDEGEETVPQVPQIATGITNDDIPLYLERILADKNSGKYNADTDYKLQRPNSGTVQANVDSFALQKGPADATAFYDFHSLQIAFDHVWHQLLDETVVNLGEQVHHAQENAGVKGILQAVKDKSAAGSIGVKQVLPLILNAQQMFGEEVPTEISSAFDISFIEYDALTSTNKSKLLELATKINKLETSLTQDTQTIRLDIPTLGNIQVPLRLNYAAPSNATLASLLRDQGERIIDNIRVNKPFSTNQLLKELQEKLMGKYEFTVFAADKDYHSINFGLMNTFRQKWEPISYQAGQLVKTEALSPKEERKYTVKTTQNIKTTRKQAQKNNSSLQQEINTTSRAESEIIAKAHDKSNFNMSVKLDYSKISSEVSFGKEAEKESSQTKKDFREAVIKAAQEFKEERSIEIDTEGTFSSEFNESGTIVNPNDELSVTYLFYELQRRYRISEQLYRVMPVVMVAQEVPSPGQITEAWVVAHDWILNRALLDDSFRQTLQYIAQKNVGDDFAIRELRKNLRQQRTLVNNLQVEFSKLKAQVENKYASLQNRVNNRIDEEHDKRFYKWWWWWGKDNRPNDPPDPEMAKAMEQAAADDHKHAVEQAERMALSVQREVNALHQLTSEYNGVMREHLDRITQVRRLLTHIKENILYYMQAIWSMEPPDQRFMRLYKVQVPYFEAERSIIIQDEPVSDVFAQFREPGQEKHVAWLTGLIKRNGIEPDVTYKQLVEVADLDTMLGFKGNYMIFPLKEHNALTKLMAAPYIDEAFGAMDPDELSNINLEEFSKYICCLHHEDPEKYETLKPVLKDWLSKLLSDPLRNGDEIIIPTGSLFIEMLPSDKSLLEDFKLKHREWDVYKVQAEVRKLELENIRYAARLLKDEREDPEVEKRIIIEGNNAGVLNPGE